MRQVLATVVHLPILTANFLNAVGKITSNTTYQAVRMPWDLEDANVVSCNIRAWNLRTIVTRLSEQGNEEWKRRIYDLNSIPGARWQAGLGQVLLLQNHDAIMPMDYSVTNLAYDIQCYNNILARVGNRLPSTLREVNWSGEDLDSELISWYPITCRLKSEFEWVTGADRTNRRRMRDGVLEVVVTTQYGIWEQAE